jgi:acyl-CoA hydrolase
MKLSGSNWESSVVSPEVVLKKIRPGMSIFLTTGVAEPRTMVRQIMGSKAKNLEDLELVQLVSFGEAISLEALKSKNFRLKTFFSGWAADKAIEEGLVDLVPSRFQKIPELISAGQIPLDMAIIQITPPNDAGYCSLGVAVDVAWEAMEKAAIKVGEINQKIPRTFGDTFVPVSEFDYLVLSEDLPIYLIVGRWMRCWIKWRVMWRP